MKSKSDKNNLNEIIPLMATAGETRASSTTKVRGNKAAYIERTNRFTNIEDGLIPFKYSGGSGASRSSINVKDAVILCQKAYYNFAVFRNIIDLMTEFSTSPIYFTGGSKKSREFLEAYFRKINLFSFQEKFFREFYRSGNVFIYRFDAKLKTEDILRITQAFGAINSNNSAVLPARYIILNPSDIQMAGNISFASGQYFKILSDYEVERLKNPATDEDLELINNLDPKVKEQLGNKSLTTITLPLDPSKVSAVFYKKQDYEPFAVPMGFPVLDDINWKAEMKKMDMAITRTMQQAILLITMGASPEQGGVNQKNLSAMQSLFQNESVGRVLIADYTTKAEFVIPDIANLLDPKKYAVVDADINTGLNNILLGGDKFANQDIKVKIFVERLRQAREVFINDFLMTEVKKICKTLGFKNYPTPHFEDIDLRDSSQSSRVYSRLIELGILTPEEGITAIETGRLPKSDESVEAQRKFIGLKSEGLYAPLIGGGAALSEQAGRPEGSTGIKQETKNVKPIGTKASFSLSKVKDYMILAQKLEEKIEAHLLKLYKLKELTAQQKQIAEEISAVIIANENPENWAGSVKDYLKNPVDKNLNRVKEVQSLAFEHQVNSYLAGILYASKTETEV